MTREEAINHLKTVAKSAIDSGYDGAVVDAVDMAIKAIEQQPCEDCISKQTVLNILDDMVKDYIKENDFDKALGVAWVKVQKLPQESEDKG